MTKKELDWWFDGEIYQSKINNTASDKIKEVLVDGTIYQSKLNIDPKTKEWTYEWYMEQRKLWNDPIIE